MPQELTAKIKLLPTSEQEELLLKTMAAYRDGCNIASEYAYESGIYARFEIQKAVYNDIREKTGLKAQQAVSVCRTVQARYLSILKNPAFQKKCRYQGKQLIPNKVEFRKPQCDLVHNKDYTIKSDQTVTISVLGDAKRLRIPFEIKGMEKFFDKNIYKFGTAKLVYIRKNFFLHIGVTKLDVNEVTDEELFKAHNIVGIDRGINFVVTSYDSNNETVFVSGRRLASYRKHFVELRRSLQKKNTPSSRRRLKAIGQREHGWMQDVNHCISKALVEAYPPGTLFVLEDLTGIREEAVKFRKKRRYVMSSWTYFDLEEKIIYKAKLRHSRVVFLDPRCSSQRCPRCGMVEKSNRNRKEHLYCCKNCGYRSNDDRVGAINMLQRGEDYLKTLHKPF